MATLYTHVKHINIILVCIVVSIPACHAGDLGSIPQRGACFYCSDMAIFFLPWTLNNNINTIYKYDETFTKLPCWHTFSNIVHCSFINGNVFMTNTNHKFITEFGCRQIYSRDMDIRRYGLCQAEFCPRIPMMGNHFNWK